MTINSDINVLGSIKDFGIISLLLNNDLDKINYSSNIGYNFKTANSFNRMRDALLSTVVKIDNLDYRNLIKEVYNNEGLSDNLMTLLFWNSCHNNELLDYLNLNVFFPAYFSGRLILKNDEVVACLNDLKQSEKQLQKWSNSTIETTASKYLSLLKKFHLLDGRLSKTIIHLFLSDQLFLCFIYWLKSNEIKSNILNSKWLVYSFMEKDFFIERTLKNKYRDFFEVQYTGDKLSIRLLSNYHNVYNAKF